MKRTTLAVLATCLALAAKATDASAAINDCNSATRDPNRPYADHLREWKQACRPQGIALAAATVFDSMVTMSSASFSNVPTWSDADILSYFDSLRDRRYLVGTQNPGVQRRISWMWPDDGCFTRAEQFVGLAGDAGKTRPYKLFAFGGLRVYTSNAALGVIDWGYHVVPIVKNTAGDPIVLDPAIEPCRPLYWKDWLALMTDNLSDFDLGTANGWGVTVGDSNAYVPSSMVTGEPSHRAESLNGQQNFYLNEEWRRQAELGRDPNVILGASPIWGGKACITSFTVGNSVNVPGNGSASSIAKCPRYATLAVGGGVAPDSPDVLITKSARNGNGWEFAARNRSSSASGIWSEVTCLQRPGRTASIGTVTSGKVAIAKGSNNGTTATCPSGEKLVGGGFLTTVGGSPSSIMKVYSSARTTGTSNSWRVSAQNNSSGSRDLTSYAYCLRNVNTTATQVTDTSAGFDGEVGAYCPSGQIVLGGGFSFPRTSSYSLSSMWNGQEGSFWIYTSPPAFGDTNVKANVECMTKP